MNKVKKIILGFVILFSMTISAQILQPAKWQQKLSKQDIKQGDIIDLIFKAKLDDTWYLYGNVQNYDIGPKKAEFEFDPNSSYKLIGVTEAINIKTKYDDVFEVNVNYFEKTAEFRQKVKILKPNATITGTYDYQVCTTVDGKCILGDDEFEFNIKTIN